MAKKKCEQCDGVAAASPRRSIAPTTARPVGFHRAANPASSSSVIRPCFSSKSGGILLFSFTIEYVQERGEWLLIPFNFAVETIAKKKVEDVMPIATGHEKEELEAELEVIPCVFFLSVWVWQCDTNKLLLINFTCE